MRRIPRLQPQALKDFEGPVDVAEAEGPEAVEQAQAPDTARAHPQ